jgi:glycerophosphoryl diester phosphodiesterase
MLPMTPLIEAHRGDSANAPENTLAAFERALGLAVPSIELDVHPARDGTLMVIHDDIVDRTTDGSGAVFDMAVYELLRLDAGAKFGPAFAGERIPRLSEVLCMVVPTRTQLNVEIKSSPAGADVARTVAGLLRQFGKQREYIVSSFDLSCLLRVRAIDPEITLALIGNGPEILPPARQYGFSWIHGNHRTVDKELVAYAHGRGIRVSVWTVDDPEMLPFWRSVGVDKICTNRPASMLAAAAI